MAIGFSWYKIACYLEITRESHDRRPPAAAGRAEPSGSVCSIAVRPHLPLRSFATQLHPPFEAKCYSLVRGE